MATVTELLRHFIQASSDPTRSAILGELEHAGELTPTQIARRLGLTANNVYHHMRILRKLELVEPPRVVPRETYVEKYYRIVPALQALIGKDPEWLDRTLVTMTVQDRKELIVAMCLTMSQVLQRAARRYEVMDAEALDELMHGQKLGMLSINEMGREQLASRLKALREIQRQEYEAGMMEEPERRGDGTLSERPHDVVLMAGLPMLWGDEPEQEHERDTKAAAEGGSSSDTVP